MAGQNTNDTDGPGPSVKDKKTYESLRDDGASKEKAARIANAKASARKSNRQDPSRKGGLQPPYDQWTKGDLYDRAKELGIEGRSSMTKKELINALRAR